MGPTPDTTRQARRANFRICVVIGVRGNLANRSRAPTSRPRQFRSTDEAPRVQELYRIRRTARGTFRAQDRASAAIELFQVAAGCSLPLDWRILIHNSAGLTRAGFRVPEGWDLRRERSARTILML